MFGCISYLLSRPNPKGPGYTNKARLRGLDYKSEMHPDVLPSSLMEQVTARGENEENLGHILTEYELIVDSEEQAIPRPKDYDEQKKFYSGKKKYHRRKNQFIVLPGEANIVDIVPGERGPKSDTLR